MDKEIYRLVFFAAFKSKFNTSSLDMDQVMTNKGDEAAPYSIRTFKYTQRCYPDDFEHYKSLVNRELVPISTLDAGVDSTIFGILYRNRLGAYVLEDDHDVIEVVFDSASSEAFVFENMFLGLSGAKIQKLEHIPCDEAHSVFAVAEIVLPAFSARSSENSFLDKRKKKICIFASYDNHKAFVESVLERERPDIVIVSAVTR